MQLTHQPLCRYCGKPIAKRTERFWITTRTDTVHRGDIVVEALPRTVAEAQRLTNNRIVSVQRTLNKREIDSFTTWDGETYIDWAFCNGDHARLFGYAAARAGNAMKAYNEAVEAQAQRKAS